MPDDKRSQWTYVLFGLYSIFFTFFDWGNSLATDDFIKFKLVEIWNFKFSNED